MDNPFFDRPILNSPYAFPGRHWELDQDGQPTGRIVEARRSAEFITPIPPIIKRRERLELSKGGRALLQGRVGEDLYWVPAVDNLRAPWAAGPSPR